MLNERSIAERLIAMGFKATVTSEWDEQCDGEVVIEGTDFHVQVGEGYVCLSEDNRRECEGRHHLYWTRNIKSWSSSSKFFNEVGSFLSGKR